MRLLTNEETFTATGEVGFLFETNKGKGSRAFIQAQNTAGAWVTVEELSRNDSGMFTLVEGIVYRVSYEGPDAKLEVDL